MAPGGGWPAAHAAKLLAEIGAAEAVQPLIEIIRNTDVEPTVAEHVGKALGRFGLTAVDATLAALAGESDQEVRLRLLGALAHFGISDDRIFDALAAEFPRRPCSIAACFFGYGDPDAIDLLLDGFDRCNPDCSYTGRWNSDTITYIKEAVEELGGSLRTHQVSKWKQVDGRRLALLDLIHRMSPEEVPG